MVGVVGCDAVAVLSRLGDGCGDDLTPSAHVVESQSTMPGSSVILFSRHSDLTTDQISYARGRLGVLLASLPSCLSSWQSSLVRRLLVRFHSLTPIR